MKPSILLIEDNASFRKAVGRILRDNGYAVREVSTGKDGLEEAATNRPDLVILDLVLPGLRGTEVCQKLKANRDTSATPILILTGNDKDGQDIALLDIGADDYLTKPVKSDRLLAHCKALLRRQVSEAKTPKEQIVVGPLELHYGRKLARLNGQECSTLTPKEFDLLYTLAACSPEPTDRETLYRRIWGMPPPSEGSLKTVDVHARRIRLKMGWSAEDWLTYVHGRGYRVQCPRR